MVRTIDLNQAVDIASAAICLLLGVLLIDLRVMRILMRRIPIRPVRYMVARRALGIAYLFMSTLTVVGLVADPYNGEEGAFTFTSLFICTSQAFLFTGAFLALLNSRFLTVRHTVINFSPLCFFAWCGLCLSPESVMWGFCKSLFLSFYGFQLIFYTVLFAIEWVHYRHQIYNYFDEEGKTIRFYKQNKVVCLFIGSLLIGIAAFCSHFFTSGWWLTLFTVIYTLYYVVVAIYFLNFAFISQKIVDVTTPERWSDTEPFADNI